MKKNIIIIIGCLLLLGCRQEVIEPEQMIQGMFALDDGSGLTNQYLLFDNGYLDIFSSDEPLPMAGKRIWSYDASLFKRDFKQHRYTISGNKIYTSDGPSGEIELKDDILTIGGKKYSVLEGFERDPYSSIVVDEEVVVPFIGQENSFPYSIENPIPSGKLTVESAADWIQGLRVQNGRIVFNATLTTIERTAQIYLSYTKADPVSVAVKQSPSTFIRLENNNLSIDYTASRQTLGYSIENPLASSSMTATTTATWISTIQILDNEIMFDVSENNSGADRSATMTLSYEGAPDVTFTVTQQWLAPLITLTPSSETIDYIGGTFSFGYIVGNPRQGLSVNAVSHATWITDVSISGSTVTYKVAENNSGFSRTGTIRLTYGNLTAVYYNLTQTYSAPIIELTPSSIEVDYTGGTFSFGYSVTNPRQGVSVEVSSQEKWITVVNISANTVKYNIVANNSYHFRDGKINLRYGSYTSASYNATQGGYPLPDGAVDLGLNVLWASCNLGESVLCSSPEEYGVYYAWGETTTKSDYAWSTYKWGTSSVSLTKYNTSSSTGTTLLPEDDVAHFKLGGAWRMPTQADFRELIDNCTGIWTTLNGKTGRKFTSNKTGYTDKWIFLPAAGFREGTSLSDAGYLGLYWSSSLFPNYPFYAYELYFRRSDNVGVGHEYRCDGLPVRPVSD